MFLIRTGEGTDMLYKSRDHSQPQQFGLSLNLKFSSKHQMKLYLYVGNCESLMSYLFDTSAVASEKCFYLDVLYRRQCNAN